jgi:hypothetical protein
MAMDDMYETYTNLNKDLIFLKSELRGNTAGSHDTP